MYRMFIKLIITNLSSLSGGEASMPRNRFVPGPEYQTVRSRMACKQASLVVFIEKHRFPICGGTAAPPPPNTCLGRTAVWVEEFGGQLRHGSSN
jgi:hypothetical protein